MQDPEGFVANGGWDFLNQEAGSDEDDSEEEGASLLTALHVLVPDAGCQCAALGLFRRLAVTGMTVRRRVLYSPQSSMCCCSARAGARCRLSVSSPGLIQEAGSDRDDSEEEGALLSTVQHVLLLCTCWCKTQAVSELLCSEPGESLLAHLSWPAGAQQAECSSSVRWSQASSCARSAVYIQH